MTANDTFRKIIDCSWRKHCRDSPCQTSSVVFLKSVLAFFFLTRSLIQRCQIVTETCKNNFSKFVGSLLNHLYHYGNENVSVTLLSLICITSILSTIYSLKIVSFMVNLAVITALTHSGSFGDIFVYRIVYRICFIVRNPLNSPRITFIF